VTYYILEQVLEHGLEGDPVAADEDVFLRKYDFRAEFPFQALFLGEPECRIDELRRIAQNGFRPVDRVGVRIEEEMFDCGAEPGGLLPYHVAVLLGFFLVADEAVRKVLRRGANDRKRSLEFVCDGGDEFLLAEGQRTGSPCRLGERNHDEGEEYDRAEADKSVLCGGLAGERGEGGIPVHDLEHQIVE